MASRGVWSRSCATLCAIGAAAGCAADGADSDQHPVQISWSELGTLELDGEGMSEVATVEVPAGQRYVALRAVPADESPDGGGLCYRFEPLSLASGRQLAPDADGYDQGPTCEQCTETLAPGRGAALTVLPTAGVPLEGPDVLQLRLVARDCALGIRASRARIPDMPQRMALSVAVDDAVLPDAIGTLDVRLAVLPGAELADELWAATWRGAQRRLADAGVDAVLTRVGQLTLDGPVEIGPSVDEALIDLEQAVLEAVAPEPDDRRFVPVVLAPCLTVRDDTGGSSKPFGYATRIPGQVSAGASLVVISAGRCGGDLSTAPWPAETGAAIVAHEMGHHLGLFHTDTIGGAAQGADNGRLMDPRVADLSSAETVLSPGQAAVLRRHPDVVFTRESSGNGR